MKYYACINGRIVSEQDALIPIGNSAYLYGQGVFETLKTVRGQVLFLRDHYRRLRSSARFLGIKVPFSAKKMDQVIRALARTNRLPQAYVRINLSLEVCSRHGPLVPRSRPSAHWSVVMRPFPGYPRTAYQQGVKVVLIRSVKNDPYPLARVKSLSQLAKRVGRQEFVRRRADEGILLGDQGQVTEATSSNIFVVQKGRVLTPPVTDGVLPGVTRSLVLRICKRQKIPFRETRLFPSDLFQADEVFLTSTLKDVMPVRSVDGKKIGSKVPGPVTRIVMKSFREIRSPGARPRSG